MGAGDDTFVWDPGDGSDVVEGQDGADTMPSTGPAWPRTSTSRPTASGSGSSATQGDITMDLNDTEFIDVQALGGADNAVVNNTTGTDLKRIAFDLEAAIGGGAGDGAADSVTVNGTNDPDDIQITASGCRERQRGSADRPDRPSEAANDKLTSTASAVTTTSPSAATRPPLIQTFVDLGGDEWSHPLPRSDGPRAGPDRGLGKRQT